LARPQVWILFVAAALFAALNGLQRPALDSLTPRLVRGEQMPAVAALQGLRSSIAMIGGPALGGILVVSVGPALAYSVDLVTFLISVCALTLMQSVPPPPDADRPSFRSVIEGLRYARSRQELLGTYLIDLNAMFFGMPMALFPAMAESYGGASVGLLYASPAVGAFLASADFRLVRESASSRTCGRAGGRRLGIGDHRLRICPQFVAGAVSVWQWPEELIW
jgi:MFS family permease